MRYVLMHCTEHIRTLFCTFWYKPWQFVIRVHEMNRQHLLQRITEALSTVLFFVQMHWQFAHSKVLSRMGSCTRAYVDLASRSWEPSWKELLMAWPHFVNSGKNQGIQDALVHWHHFTLTRSSRILAKEPSTSTTSSDLQCTPFWCVEHCKSQRMGSVGEV